MSPGFWEGGRVQYVLKAVSQLPHAHGCLVGMDSLCAVPQEAAWESRAVLSVVITVVPLSNGFLCVIVEQSEKKNTHV